VVTLHSLIRSSTCTDLARFLLNFVAMETGAPFPKLLGNAALDFANTGIAAIGDPAGDVLASLDRFLAWCRHAGVDAADPADPAGADTDRIDAHASAPEERAFIHVAARLRGALIEIASALAAHRQPDPASIAELQTRYVEAIGHACGATELSGDNTLTWSWAHRPPAERALWKLTDIAVELFRHGALERLKACDACQFVYLDASKNNSRRWCSMDDCGTDAKMRRYVERRAARRVAGAGSHATAPA